MTFGPAVLPGRLGVRDLVECATLLQMSGEGLIELSPSIRDEYLWRTVVAQPAPGARAPSIEGR
eukprot:3279229-Pyramimonas_sp.AAC.1